MFPRCLGKPSAPRSPSFGMVVAELDHRLDRNEEPPSSDHDQRRHRGGRIPTRIPKFGIPATDHRPAGAERQGRGCLPGHSRLLEGLFLDHDHRIRHSYDSCGHPIRHCPGLRRLAVVSSFWHVPEDFWIIQRRSRWARTLRISVEGEPMRKGRLGKRSAASVQRQIIDQMQVRRRYPFTGPIALDLHAVAARKNPPSIHQVAKYLLDVLGTADPSVSKPRRRSVLYRDDRQVKYLYVALDQAWNRHKNRTGAGQDGSTYLIASADRDVVSDFREANRLRRDDVTANDDQSSPFWCPELPDDPDWYEPAGTPAAESSALQSYLEKSYRFYSLMRMQESLLARNDAILISALSGYLDEPPWPPKGSQGAPAPPTELVDLMLKTQLLTRGQLLANPLTVALPALPQASGTSSDFASKVRHRLQSFRARWHLFRPLVMPIKATFLVVPPAQGKDLDNIALTVLPIVHDVLKPHIEPHLLAPTHPDNGSYPNRDKALTRLRSLNADSVTAYQVIELPRTQQDPPEGVLRLALGADTGRSWWHHLADYIDERADQIG